MKEVTKKTPRSAGFTLIELLIVIIIIGVLAGVLIAVIDPVRQQNRSRNAAIRSAIQKIAYGLNSARSGIGRLPGEVELTAELENIVLDPNNNNACDGGATPADVLDCNFDFPGTLLPVSCSGADEISGASAAAPVQCEYLVVSGPLNAGAFRIIAKVYELSPDAVDGNDTIYVFDSSQGLWECPASSGGNARDPVGHPDMLGDVDAACARVNQ